MIGELRSVAGYVCPREPIALVIVVDGAVTLLVDNTLYDILPV